MHLEATPESGPASIGFPPLARRAVPGRLPGHISAITVGIEMSCGDAFQLHKDSPLRGTWKAGMIRRLLGFLALWAILYIIGYTALNVTAFWYYTALVGVLIVLAVGGAEYSVRLSTLVDSSPPTTQSSFQQ